MTDTPTQEAKIHNPAAHFDEPHEVLGDASLSQSEKAGALETLEQDARQLSEAASEGMGGGEPNKLREVLVAQKSLESAAHLPNPLLFEPAMEQIGDNEAKIIEELDRTLTGIAETTLKDSGHATRSVHAKGHGLLRGRLQVLDDLPAVLKQGMFAEMRSFPVVMRLSTIPGDMLSDDVSTPRGMALKVIGVAGPRLSGSENDTTQDWVLVNGPAFGAPTPEKFLGSLKLVAATTDKAPELKRAFSSVARAAERVLEAFGTKSGTILTLGGQPMTNILGETFYSQAPVIYGPYVAKISIVPVSPGLVALTDAPVDMHDRPNALRETVAEHFRHASGEWELRVQLCTDLETMPIEDASVAWPEAKSPYLAVARIVFEPQDSWSTENILEIDQGMSFSPWHGLAAHRPLGAVMRARKATYESSSQFRGTKNGCPIHEPRA